MALPRTHENVLAWLREQPKVDFVTTVAEGEVILVMTRDEKLVETMEKRGAQVRWYDRTEFSTRNGISKADMQCEILLGPKFWVTEMAS